MITYTSPLTSINSNDKNSVNTWQDLFTSLEVTYGKILAKKSSLSIRDYDLLLKAFLQCCVDNIEYQYKKFITPNKEFDKVSMEYLDKISEEVEENIKELILV